MYCVVLCCIVLLCLCAVLYLSDCTTCTVNVYYVLTVPRRYNSRVLGLKFNECSRKSYSVTSLRNRGLME